MLRMNSRVLTGKRQLFDLFSCPYLDYPSYRSGNSYKDAGQFIIHQNRTSLFEYTKSAVHKEGLSAFCTKQPTFRPYVVGFGCGGQQFGLPGVLKLSRQSVRAESTTRSRPSKESSRDEDSVDSVAKAKTEDKKLHEESQRSATSIKQKFWITVLGTGSISRADLAMKFRQWKVDCKSSMRYYWCGLKLLWSDVRASSKLMFKVANGEKLSKMQRRQLTGTTADIFRLVPFAVFIIVPFMEIFLPVFLKIFPNMLPSTFNGKMEEQEKLKRQLKARLEYAKFLQETAEEMEKGHHVEHARNIMQASKYFGEHLDKEEHKGDKMKDYGILQDKEDLAKLTSLTSTVAEKLVKAKALEKQEQLCKISHALAILASASSVSKEHQEFLAIVSKEIKLYNAKLENAGAIREAQESYLEARQSCDHAAEAAPADEVSSVLRNKVHNMIQKLEKEIDDVDAVGGTRWKLLDSDHDGKVTPEEVAAAAMCLKDTLASAGIEQVISNLSRDKEGKILVEDIIKLGHPTEHRNANQSD